MTTQQREAVENAISLSKNLTSVDIPISQTAFDKQTDQGLAAIIQRKVVTNRPLAAKLRGKHSLVPDREKTRLLFFNPSTGEVILIGNFKIEPAGE